MAQLRRVAEVGHVTAPARHIRMVSSVQSDGMSMASGRRVPGRCDGPRLRTGQAHTGFAI
eukprot:7413653-Pyramimonas_sp.AAC.1